jgi:Uma2 family endonuclease
MKPVELPEVPQGRVIEYPTSDGQPMAETEIHVLLMIGLIGTLRAWMRTRQVPAYVMGNTFLYFEEGNPEARRSPDVMVVKCNDPEKVRPSVKIWEESASPCVVIELTSQGTADGCGQSSGRFYT